MIHPAPPPGHSIVVSGYVDGSAVGENGIVLVGTVSAQLDRALLPESVRDAYVRHLGRIDVRDGRVVAWIYNDEGKQETLFDEPASGLGITADEARYLAGSDESRSEMAVWTAGWGKPIRQWPATGVDLGQRYGNFSVTRVSDGFVLTAPTATASEMWWSRDGRSWQHLAPPPRGVVGEDDSWLVELGSRWVVASAGVVSDDRGRSWTPIDFTGDLATTRGTGSLFGSRRHVGVRPAGIVERARCFYRHRVRGSTALLARRDALVVGDARRCLGLRRQHSDDRGGRPLRDPRGRTARPGCGGPTVLARDVGPVTQYMY